MSIVSQYYDAITKVEARSPEAGTFFYGPVIFEPIVKLVVRPWVNAKNEYEHNDDGQPIFDVYLPPPDDAFLDPDGFGPDIGPHVELMGVPGKMRPMVILSLKDYNKNLAIVIPSYTFPSARVKDEKIVQMGNHHCLFYLPPEPLFKVEEGFLDLTYMQPVSLMGISPGNRKPDEGPCFLRLKPRMLTKLKTKVSNYMGL